jgi:hypothetical protein
MLPLLMSKVFGFILMMLIGLGIVAASTIPSGFIVEVNPSTFDVNQAVDVTIKAMNASG